MPSELYLECYVKSVRPHTQMLGLAWMTAHKLCEMIEMTYVKWKGIAWRVTGRFHGAGQNNWVAWYERQDFSSIDYK